MNEKEKKFSLDYEKNPYHECLEIAGARVLAFESFGSYQGDWWAKVVYGGKTFFVTDYYGSCSGCDAFEAEFEWGGATREDYAAFGRQYLVDDGKMRFFDDNAAIERASENGWDATSDEMVEWVKAHALTDKVAL